MQRIHRIFRARKALAGRWLKRITVSVRAAFLVAIYRFGRAEERAEQTVGLFIGRFAASIAAILLVSGFIAFGPSELFDLGTASDTAKNIGGLKISEVLIGIAAITGTALALVVSLFIIPAQKAAEVYSPAILRLFIRDSISQLMLIFLSIVALVCSLAGTNWFFGLAPGFSLSVGIVLLGFSLDALRAFYKRIATLLIPDTALDLVLGNCQKVISAFSNHVDSLERVRKVVFGGTAEGKEFYKSLVSDSYPDPKPYLNLWTEQLTEIARRSLSRGDTLATKNVSSTLMKIGQGYIEARKDSAPFILGHASYYALPIEYEVWDVVRPICEGLVDLCRRSAKHDNEAAAISTIRGLEGIALTTVKLKNRLADGYTKEPLILKAVGSLGDCVIHVAGPGLPDARLELSRSVLRIHRGPDLTGSREASSAACARTQCHIAVACYANKEGAIAEYVIAYLLQGVSVDIMNYGFSCRYPVHEALGYIAALLEMHVSLGGNALTPGQEYGPYIPYSESGIARLFVLAKNSMDSRDKAIEEVSDLLQEHFQHVAGLKSLKGGMLPYNFCVSALETANLIVDFLKSIDDKHWRDSLRSRVKWLIDVSIGVYSKREGVEIGYAPAVAEVLADLAITCLDNSELELAHECVATIRSLGKIICAGKSDSPYVAADPYVALEYVKEAATMVGNDALARELQDAFAADIEGIAGPHWPELVTGLALRMRRRDGEPRHNWYGHPHPSIALARLKARFELQGVS